MAEEVVLEGCKASGLGIRIVGGQNIQQTGSRGEANFGIFVKEVLPDRLAAKDGEWDENSKTAKKNYLAARCSAGRLAKGDQIMEANGISLIGVTNRKYVPTLCLCSCVCGIFDVTHAHTHTHTMVRH